MLLQTQRTRDAVTSKRRRRCFDAIVTLLLRRVPVENCRLIYYNSM